MNNQNQNNNKTETRITRTRIRTKITRTTTKTETRTIKIRTKIRIGNSSNFREVQKSRPFYRAAFFLLFGVFRRNAVLIVAYV